MMDTKEKSLNIHIGNWLSHHYNWLDKNKKIKRQSYFNKVPRVDMAKSYYNSLDEQLKIVYIAMFDDYDEMIMYIAKTIDWLLPKRLFYKLMSEKGVNGKIPPFYSITQIHGMKYEFEVNSEKDKLRQDFILCTKLKSKEEPDVKDDQN